MKTRVTPERTRALCQPRENTRKNKKMFKNRITFNVSKEPNFRAQNKLHNACTITTPRRLYKYLNNLFVCVFFICS